MEEPTGNIRHPDPKSFVDFDGIVERHIPPSLFSTTYWKFYENDDAYAASLSKEFSKTTVEEVAKALQRVPDENIYPELDAGVHLRIIQSAEVQHDRLFIKRPLLQWIEDADCCWIRDSFLTEAMAVEKISQKPHENIAKYHGCYQREGRLTGIALERYDFTLWDYIRRECGNLDKEVFMKKLESAVSHLHSMGLAHNELKPTKIMLDTGNMPVLVDFGCCQPFGESLMPRRPAGFEEESIRTSKKENDIVRLRCIREWLEDPTQVFPSC